MLSLQRTSTGRPPRLASLAGVVLDALRSSPASPGPLRRRRQLRQEVVREAQYEFVSRPELASFRYHLTAMCANMQQNLSNDVFILYERTHVFESHRNNQNVTICAVLPNSTLYLDLARGPPSVVAPLHLREVVMTSRALSADDPSGVRHAPTAPDRGIPLGHTVVSEVQGDSRGLRLPPPAAATVSAGPVASPQRPQLSAPLSPPPPPLPPLPPPLPPPPPFHATPIVVRVRAALAAAACEIV